MCAFVHVCSPPPAVKPDNNVQALAGILGFNSHPFTFTCCEE